MYWLAVRRTLRRVSVYILIGFLAAAAPCNARPFYVRGYSAQPPALIPATAAMDFLLFGILGLAAAAAAVAVRMVRRWH